MEEKRFRWHQFPGYNSFTFFSDKFFLMFVIALVFYIFQVLFTTWELTIEQYVMLGIEGLWLLYIFSMRKKNFQFINGRFSAYKVFYDAVAGKTFSKQDYLGDSEQVWGISSILKKAALMSFFKVNK